MSFVQKMRGTAPSLGKKTHFPQQYGNEVVTRQEAMPNRPEPSGANAFADSAKYDPRKHGLIDLRPDLNEMADWVMVPPTKTVQGRKTAAVKNRDANAPRYYLRSMSRGSNVSYPNNVHHDSGHGAEVSFHPFINGVTSGSASGKGKAVKNHQLAAKASQHLAPSDLSKPHVFDDSEDFVIVEKPMKRDVPSRLQASQAKLKRKASPVDYDDAARSWGVTSRTYGPPQGAPLLTDKRRKVDLGKCGNPLTMSVTNIVAGPVRYAWGTSKPRRAYRNLMLYFPQRRPIPCPTHVSYCNETGGITNISIRDREDDMVDIGIFTENPMCMRSGRTVPDSPAFSGHVQAPSQDVHMFGA
ncbi:hypothetical protein BCR34DRAFT_376820 [Clohesyomyces aquaticus]|uniref:Uncharacterized protein n=1 Tax=Clohesyomyces aquaticus TaxID=1231657 RepID=A0A1Y2A5Z4_9PLEO|nr:hypothetical protein BCR34DRAFT_376820 [Clohesyomyces aquaticus]